MRFSANQGRVAQVNGTCAFIGQCSPRERGHAVQAVPAVLPSPKFEIGQPHVWVPGPVCVHRAPSTQSCSSLLHGLFTLHELSSAATDRTAVGEQLKVNDPWYSLFQPSQLAMCVALAAMLPMMSVVVLSAASHTAPLSTPSTVVPHGPVGKSV